LVLELFEPGDGSDTPHDVYDIFKVGDSKDCGKKGCQYRSSLTDIPQDNGPYKDLPFQPSRAHHISIQEAQKTDTHRAKWGKVVNFAMRCMYSVHDSLIISEHGEA
jgi:hypothetical protein